MKKHRSMWTRLARAFALPQRRRTARPSVEPLGARIAPANLLWLPVNWQTNGVNASDPHNYLNLDTGQQNTATTFSTSDVLNFQAYVGTAWDRDAQFQSSVTVGGVQVKPSWTTSSDPHNIYINDGVMISTTADSLINSDYATISMKGTSILELHSGTWTSGTVYGGELRCDSGTVTINPAAGSSVAANTYLHVEGGRVNYNGQGDISLQDTGFITIDSGGYFLGQVNPMPPDGADQHITASGNTQIVAVDFGTFEVNGYTHYVGIPVNVDGGTLLVDAGTVLSDHAGNTGVSASAGTIQLAGGQQGAPTTIDTGSTGLVLTGDSVLETINDSASFHYSQVIGDLLEDADATVWVGYHLNGVGFSSGLGANLFVSGNVLLKGTLEVGVYTFGNPRPVVGYVAAYLSSNGTVSFDTAGDIFLDEEGPGRPQSGDDLLIVDCTPGSGTTNEPAFGPVGYEMGLEHNNQQLWLTAD